MRLFICKIIKLFLEISTDWGTEDADDEDVSVWEDNWEDDIVQDDFNQQLRLEYSSWWFLVILGDTLPDHVVYIKTLIRKS